MKKNISKTLILCMSIISMILSTTYVSAETDEIFIGGYEEPVYDLADAQAVLKAALKIQSLEESGMGMEIDFNKNGIVEMSDANIVLQIALNIISLDEIE